ncbi:MAG: histidine--tRNA ligase [Gammaproteobacteria bacterium]
MEKINSLTGMSDLIGEKNKDSNQSDKIFQVEKKLVEIFENYSLQEIRTPALESEKLFNRSVGDSSDIVNKELYTFKDKNEKSISLRPEGTAGVVRSIIEKKLDNENHRFWYLGPMWRYERPQKGRYRQFYQAGVELLGYEEGLSELEMISMVISINLELNINNSIIKINHLGDKETKEKFCKSLKKYLEPHTSNLDKKDIDRLNKNPLRILDSKNTNTQNILKKAPKISDFISDEASNLLNTIQNTYPDNKIEIDHSLVRGLDYYTGFVFEAISENLGAQDSYLGGGRYDQLFEDLGGKSLPAIGMAIGIERLSYIANNEHLESTLVSFIILSDKIEEKAYKIAHNLRSCNKKLIIEVQLSGGSLKSRLRRANKDNATFAIIIGKDELDSDTVILKSLKEENSNQKQLTIDELEDFLKSID